MNVEISVFVICVKAIIYLLLCILHDCTFKVKKSILSVEQKCTNFNKRDTESKMEICIHVFRETNLVLQLV